MALGSVLPWARAGFVSLPGTRDDGVFALIAGALVIVLAVVAKDRPSKVIRVGVLVLFAFGLWLTWNAFRTLSDLDLGSTDVLFGTQVGSGLIVTAAAAAVGLIFLWIWLIRRVPAASPPATTA